ncbi:FimV/HubP family polar landmark protein [Pseudomonas sp. TTU2014-080ASC]|uniref:FimV/HubP family polar landmark protein n=1 Tax=Pseudomonas sp. TTU2014-080ASC TaxID=1729724 RepID=UPI0007188BF0|nr:FimV/HubP family polar landmark protein [Pseudomonas sp. TTU2014-080ASC]KRW59523.1 peptigoglycan-binding protein LysM [Pseudomonas sp. TTU2014-080ASC]
MVRVRKLVLAIAAASALTSGMAHALGLGEVTLRSALNQPLLAEIELLETRDLSAGELVPALASQEDFSKAGVDRQYFLSDLKFTSVVKPNGKSVILVTSSKPMREPYLNFLVEVLWPNGRLLREYTLLLDPPLYTPQSVIPSNTQMPVVSSPAPRIQAPQPTPRPTAVTPAPRPVAPSATPVAGRAPSTPSPKLVGSNEYRTSSNDTLWEIARSARGNGSVHQAMLAIQDLNPGAFIDGNINRLKSGQVLRLPTDEQIRSRSQQEAISQVTEQNTAWREGRSLSATARQLDATRRTTAEPAPAKVEQTDSLKLVAAESGKSTAGSEAGVEDSKALANKLAVTQESLDSSRRESEELKGRLADLQSQLDKLQRLVELKDSQLAKLQSDLAAQSQETATAETSAAEPVVTPQPAATAPAVEPSPAAEIAPAQVPAEAEPAAVAPAAEASAELDYNYSEEPVAPAVAEAEQPAAPAPAAVEPAKPAAPAVTATESVPVEESILDKILANPMWLGLAGGAALLALLLALMIVSRRNAMKEAELQQNLVADADKSDEFDADMQLPDDSFEGLNDSAESALHESASEERVSAQTADVLGEADIYIAYGRFPQAAELLEGAIKDEPARADLRLKLMEVYAEMGEQNGFAAQEAALRAQGVGATDVEQLKSRYPAMMPALAATAAVGTAGFAAAQEDELNLDDLQLDEPTAELAVASTLQPVVENQPEPLPADLDDAFDLSFDDLDAELERDLQTSTASTELDSLSLDSDEFSASLDEIQSAELATDDALEFDIGFADTAEPAAGLEPELNDFSLELDAPAQPSVAAEDDFLLNLDEVPAAAPVTQLDEAPAFEPLSADLQADDFDLSADFDLAESDTVASQAPADSFASQLDKVSAELDELSNSLPQAGEAQTDLASFDGLDADDDFDFLSGADETSTKLDLARAYIDMGDAEGARDILSEVINEGNEGQQQEARELIAKLV